MADPENPDTTARSHEVPASGDIGLTMSYIISIPGILKIVEFVSTSVKCVESFLSRTKGGRGWRGTNED